MQPPGENILPIFNKKKRPRQAVLTYPNKANEPSNSSGSRSNQCFQLTNSPAQQPGYMPPNSHQFNSAGFQNARNIPSNTTSSSGNKSRSFKGPSTGSQPGFLGQPRPARAQNNGRAMIAPNKNMAMQRQPPAQAHFTPRNNQPQYGSGGSSGKENQYRSTPQQGNRFQPSNASYPNPNKRQYVPSSTSQIGPTGPSHSSSAGQYGARNVTQVNNKQAVLLPFQGPRTDGMEETSSKPATTTSAPDKTVKILTSSIEGMKHWSQYTDCVGLLLFEMFGILNSAISTNDAATAKMFSLKDGQHTQKCIFYETDRKLERLTRGQWLRCIGNLDKKTGLFRVVTVRAATQQEQGMSKAIISKCDQAMNDRLAEMQEQ